MSSTVTSLGSFSSVVTLNTQGSGIIAGAQDAPAVLTLDAQRYATAWISNSSGAGESVQFGIFNFANQQLASTSASITELTGGTANLYSIGMARLSDGNVALAWAEHSGGTTTYRTAVVDGSSGAVITAPAVVASAAITAGAISIAARANGYVIAYSADATPASADAMVAGFTNGGASDPGFTSFVGAEHDAGVAELSVAVLTNGTIVVISEGAATGAVMPLSRGGNVSFNYWNADGSPVMNGGQPVFGAAVGAYVDSRIASAALPNGNVVYAYDNGNLTDDVNKLVVAVRGPLGEYIGGGETFVLSAQDQLWPSIAVLPDGGFAVSWSRRLVSDGSPTGTLVAAFRADGTQVNGTAFVLTATSDTAALAAAPDGRLVLVAEGGNDGAGTGIIASSITVAETLTGTAGNDELNGSALASQINGLDGADTLRGGDGNDLISGDGSFTLGGADVIDGGDGSDTISGMAGDDVLFGGVGNDSLSGGNGEDVLRGNDGNDTMEGEAGHDTYVVDATGDVVRELASQGTDTVWSSATSWVVPFNVEIVRLFGSGTTLSTAFEGNPGGSIIPRIYVANPDTRSSLTGGQGADELWGGNAGDTLNGGNGDDTMRGQGGTDSMSGGAGNDHYVVDEAADIVVESTSAGLDTAWVTTSGWMVAANVEIARLLAANALLTGNAAANIMATGAAGSTLAGGEGDDELWGNDLAQRLEGGDGDDIIRGGGGGDTLAGGFGNDQYVVLSATDSIIEQETSPLFLFLDTDTAWYGISGMVMAAHVEFGRLYDSAASLTGSAQDNQLVANAAVASILDGAAGADTLWGSALGETMTGGAGDDVIYTYGGADRISYAATGWGFDQVVAFDRAGGAKFDMRGSGLTFQDLAFTSADGNTQFATPQDRTLIYGMASLEVSDFIF